MIQMTINVMMERRVNSGKLRPCSLPSPPFENYSGSEAKVLPSPTSCSHSILLTFTNAPSMGHLNFRTAFVTECNAQQPHDNW